MSKIDKLNKELNKQLKERTTLRKNAEYHARKREAATSPKDFEKQTNKENFYRFQISKLDRQIDSIKIKIREEEAKLQIKAYNKKLRDFKLEMWELLLSLKKALEENRLVDSLTLTDEAYNCYNSRHSSFDKKDLEPFGFIAGSKIGLPGNVKIRISNIMETLSRAGTVSKIYGPKIDANLKDKAARWTRQLISQIEDCLEQIKR